MAMELAHGVITGRQTHGVEADVDMRGESGSSILSFDPYFVTPHRNLEQVRLGESQQILTCPKDPPPSRSNIAIC